MCSQLKLSIKRTSPIHLLKIVGLLTQESQPDRTFGESVSGTFEMDSSDESNEFRYQAFDTRSDTDIKLVRLEWERGPDWR
jgi:hypothetical protein